MKTSVRLKTNFLLLLVALLVAATASAQTYTTQSAGNWSNPAIWVGGQVPNRTIAAGSVVNIKHRVNADLTGDLVINGTLNITGDTLVFASSFDKNTTIAPTGLLVITNGGYWQDLSQHKANLTVNGGRVSVTNGLLAVGKTFAANAGSRRSFVGSKVQTGQHYQITGTSASPAIDTIKTTTVEVSLTESGDLSVGSYGTLRVDNAKVTVAGGNFSNGTGAAINVLPAAAGNYGFVLLRTSNDLENKGSWNARIDQLCVGGTIKGSAMADIDITRSQDCTTGSGVVGAAAPELIFRNPTLVQGQANKQGAVYRFTNVTTGIDAEMKLVKFSRPDIVMQSVDLASMGWDKAFQPQFGLPGNVAPFQNWYVDFEVTFYKAGTSTKQKMSKVDMTALDVDGDGLSISEYATFEAPSNIIYSTVNYLTSGGSAGLAGQSFLCPLDNLTSVLLPCTGCGGDGLAGLWNIDDCAACDGTGFVYTACSHAYAGVTGTTLTGPIENFVNIDTAATAVMATYQFTDRDRIKFRYGAKSSSAVSNAGVRLNSLWFRQFSMAPLNVLPVRLSQFTASYDKKHVHLEWKGFEENFSHYVLQRSTDGREYRDIAVIFTAGNGQQQTYRYKDQNVSSPTGNVFYRLVMVDLTKEAAFSEIKTVRLNANTDALALATYPNPVQNEVRMTLPAALQGKAVTFQVHSMNGTPVLQKYFGQTGQTESLNISSLPRGSYVIRANSGDVEARQVIIKN